MWAGYRPIAVLASRIVSGERTNATTGDVTETEWKEVLGDFLRSKFSPLAGTIASASSGRDAIGNPYGVDEAAFDLLVPLFFRELVEAGQNAGPAGFARGLTAGLGLGVNTFEVTPFDKAAREAGFDAPYSTLTRAQKQLIDDLHPELVDERSKQIIARGGPQGDYERKKVDLRAEQMASDAMLAAGQMPPSEWRDQRNSRRDGLRVAREVAFADLPEKKNKDAADFYWDQVEAQKRPDGTIDWDKVEAWVASQSAEDQQLIDDETEVGGTETERQYRNLITNLDESGYFEISDRAWEATKTADPVFAQMLGQFEDYRDWSNAVITAYSVELQKAGMPEGAARSEAKVLLGRLPMTKEYAEAVQVQSKMFTIEHPNLMDQAAKWDIGELDAMERAFLTQVLGPGQ